ncbi:MAG TPA: hypothetical protein VM370_09030 [Candidatus Thermoplasmatota archaeon]|nr:hypothetical protein [Candidatus Thermoplasmatota archaeon]
MSESTAATKAITLRVRTDILAALEAAGIAPGDVARAALEREAVRAKQLATIRKIQARAGKDKFALGFDATEFIRKDRDTDHGRDLRP